MNSFERVAEGGCGVIGVASSIPIKGRFLLRPLLQMHNRGNGKGGGIAAVGLSAEQLGISRRVLEECYLIQIAYLDSNVREDVEASFIKPFMRVEYFEKLPTLGDYRRIGLEVKPPEVWRYFLRVDEDVLKKFAEDNSMRALDPRDVEDEFIYRNSFALNRKYYSSTGLKKAFVLSHGRNMIVLKIVGYAEQVIKYYMLEDLEAHIWIGHQRYPTKGKVWHPGGSHPFIGLNDALVHNGDFANYYSITEYLRQRNIYPLFLTDTEVAALYWDLLTRIYRYPLEYAIEALAPTTERDFAMLPDEKKKIYKAIQATHIHGSPDGPWFFIIARNDVRNRVFQLIGITDTSMLRPQVFALHDGDVKIGIIASERQAIDAMLEDLSKHDERIRPMADAYWYARGGSYTDGGAFIYTVDEYGGLVCTDKFGRRVAVETSIPRVEFNGGGWRPEMDEKTIKRLGPEELFKLVSRSIGDWSIRETVSFIEALEEQGMKGSEETLKAISVLTLLIDRRYPSRAGRNRLIPLFEKAVSKILSRVPLVEANFQGRLQRVDWDSRRMLAKPSAANSVLVIDAHDFPPEGYEGVCNLLENAYRLGWRRLIAYNFIGQRNFGAGLVARDGVRIDVYGRPGDCLAAFADGPEFHVHGSVQDSVAYCFRSGRIVVYGDAGKAFEYGAKGGIAFILGDLVDRPLINAVGSATAVINGSCMDYMGESFMAAKGFIILNGIGFDAQGRLVEKETPYHGGNLLPLAAAGAVYIRDPRGTVGEDQLNGGRIESITSKDWEKILLLLRENERLFGIRVEDLLRVNGVLRKPEEVYRKVVPVQVAALTRYERGD
jgi:glutamate synthase domain-containing protein 1/glutamate synthase domain-containing protein 3